MSLLPYQTHPLPALRQSEEQTRYMLSSRILVQEWRVVFLCIVIGIVAGMISVSIQPKSYEARTLFAVNQLEEVNRNLPSSVQKEIADTHIETLVSVEMARHVAKEMSLLEKSRLIGNKRQNNDRDLENITLETLYKQLVVMPINDSDVIDLRFRHHQPEMASIMANLYVTIYQKILQQQKTTRERSYQNASINTLTTLEESLNAALARRHEIEGQLNGFDGQEVETTSLQLEENSQKLAALKTQLSKLSDAPGQLDYTVPIEITALKTQIEQLEFDQQSLEEKRNQQNKIVIEKSTRERDVLHAREKYEQALEQKNHAEASLNYDSGLQVLAEATTPFEHRKMPVILTLLCFTGVGLLAGFFVLLSRR